METYDQFIDSGLSWDEFEATALKPEEPDDYDAFIDSGLSWDEFQAKAAPAPAPAPVTPADREPIYAELGLPVPDFRIGKPPEEYTEEFSAKRLGKQAITSVGQGFADIGRFAKATAEIRRLDEFPMPFPKYTGWEQDPTVPRPGAFRGAMDIAAGTTYDQRQFGSILRDIAEIEGSNPSPDRIDEEWKKYLESKQKAAVQGAQDYIDMFPEIMEGSSGIVEDAMTGMARFLPTMGISYLNPIAGTAMTFTQIAGSSYDDYRKQGVEPDKAFNVAVINSLVQTPLEMAGNLLQIRVLKNLTKSLGRSVGIGIRLERFTGALLAGAVGEGMEEFLQQYPDEISNIYLANPDLTPEEVAQEVWKQKGEITKKGKKAMVVGGVGGLMLAGGVQTLSIPTDLSSYISEKQAKINKEKGIEPEVAPAEGVPPPAPPTPEAEAGLPPGYVLASPGEEGAVLFGRADGPPVYGKPAPGFEAAPAEEATPSIEEVRAKYEDGTFTDEDLEDHKVIFGDDAELVAGIDKILKPAQPTKETPFTEEVEMEEIKESLRTKLIAKLKKDRPDIEDLEAAKIVDDAIARTEEFIPIEDEADPAEFSTAVAKEEGAVLPGSAAIKIGGKVYGPAQTHLQVIAEIPTDILEPYLGEWRAHKFEENVIDGFLTDKGVFVDRKKALTLVPPAVAKGKKKLVSEDLAEFSIAPATATDIKAELKLTQFKRKAPEDSYAIRKGRARVGHIVGESSEVTKQSNIFKDNPDLGLKAGDTYYRIANTRLEKEHRGKGIYQAKIQEIANKYDAGALVHKFEASQALQKALRKIPGVVENDNVILVPPAKAPAMAKEDRAAFEFKAEDVDALRKRTVKRALAEGKTVPAEVLKDYPDLQPPAPAINIGGKVIEPAEFSVAVAAEAKISGKGKQKDLKKTLTLIEGGKYEYIEERQKRILEQAEFVREEDAKNEAAAQIVTIKNDRFPQQTISTIVEAQAWLKENGFPQIAEKGQTAKLIKRLVKDENFQKLNIFDKTRVAAQLERVIREYDYKPVIAIGGNAKTKGLLGTKGIGEIENITGSGIRIADCVAGCDHYCFECYALKGAAQGQKCHQHPVLAKLTSYLKTGEVLRIGEKGDPSRAWGHTNEQIRLMLARSEKRKQDVSPDNIYFTTKLLNLEGFDPQIQRHLQVTLDPLFPDHMIRTMENILRVKAAHPDVVIVARIRSIHTTNKDLNESTQAAVEFANQYNLPILETRMRFIRKSSFDVLELDKTKYKWDGSQYKMTSPALKEESEDYHLCDVKNKSCPACKNCVKLVQSRKKLIPKQTKAIKAAGIDGVSIAASQAFDPVGLTEDGLVPEFSLKPEPGKGRLSPAQKVIDIINPIIKTWTNFPVVRVVQNTNSLPKRLRNQAVAQERKTKGKVEGLYDPQTDQVFLIADNLAEGRIEDVLRHEAEGHRGLRLMMGTGLDSFLDKVAAAKQAELLAMAPGLNLKDKAAVRRVANEWAARHIEAGTMKPLWHGRLVYAFKQWLRKFFPGLKMTDADIKTALYDTVMHVREGRPGILRKGDTTSIASEKAEEWFRQMDQVLERKLPKTGTAESYIQAIESYVKKGDFKQEELEWSGIMGWLKGDPAFLIKDPKGKLSKQDILDYLYLNHVRIEEIERAARPWETPDDVQDRIDQLQSIPYGEETAEEDLELDELMTWQREKQLAALPTVYGDYTLAGGVDYKELILRLPKGIGPQHMVSIVQDGELVIVHGKRMTWDAAVLLYAPELNVPTLKLLRTNKGKAWFLNFINNEIVPAIRTKLGAIERTPKGYIDKYGHADSWDTDNILAHIRFDTRTGPNGEKILHIAEIQSDWHQEGRKVGYYAPKETRADAIEIAAKTKFEKEADYLNKDWEELSEAARETWRRGVVHEEAAAVPDAPFKRTQAWVTLAMKRMVRYAAENNFDVVSWDVGQTNADRYNLSNHVNKIAWVKKGDRYSIQAMPIRSDAYEGRDWIDVANNIPASEIENHVGKGLSDKITTDTSEEYLNVPTGEMMQEGEISGLDLAIGGEKMVVFYDKMVPDIVNRFFNKATWGKAKVGTIDLEQGSAGLMPRKYKGPEISMAQILKDRDAAAYDTAPLLKQSRQIALLMKGGDSFKTAVETYGSIAFAKFYGGELISEYKKATVHALPITPEMKTKAIHEGMPLFREQTKADYPHPTKTTESKGIIFIGADGMGADWEGKVSPLESFRYANYHKAWTLGKGVASAIHKKAKEGYTHVAVVTYKHVRDSMRNHPHFREALRRAMLAKHGKVKLASLIEEGQAMLDEKNAKQRALGKEEFTNTNAEYLAAVSLKGLARGETIDIARDLAVDDWKTRGGKIIGIGIYGGKGKADPDDVYTGQFKFDSYHELPTAIGFTEFMDTMEQYKGNTGVWMAMNQRGFVLNKKEHPMSTKLMAGATGEFAALEEELREKPELTPEVAINVHFSTAKQELTARQRALLEKHYPAKLAELDKKTGGTIPEKSKEDFETFADMGEVPGSPEGFNMPHEGVGRQVFDTIQFKIQDRFNSLRKVQDVIERQITPLPEAANVHQVEELYHGIVSERVGAFDSEHVDGLIEAIHESGFDLEEVEAYLYARHAEEANAQLEKINPKVKDNKALSGLSNEDAAKILAQYEGSKEMQDIAARIDAITKAGRDILVKEGLATPKQIAAWENIYEYYIPLKREGKIAGMPKKGQGVNIAGPESKRRLTGSAERRAVNIVANVVSQHEAIIIRAEKAKVGRAMLKLAEAFPNKELWEVDAKQLKPHLKQRSSEQIDDETGLPQTLNEVVLGKDILYKFNDNVLVVKIDGKERTITFNEKNVHAQRIVRGLKNLGAQDMNAFIGTLAKVNRWLAIVNTSANPEFIISNFARDIQTAGYNISDTAAKNMKRKVFKDVFRSLQGIRRGIRGDFSSEWAQEYKNFVKAGAQTGWTDHYKNIESREKSLKKQLDLMKDGTFRSMKRGAKGLMEFISNENTAVENAIRLSVYKHLKDAGASDATAASAAKNLTVNFNRRGDMGQTLNAMYLFFNANVQGSARLIYAAARSAKVRRMMYATVAFAVMLDIANRAIGGEDDDGENRYDKVPPWVKEHNLVMMRSNGDYFKIPLPWGYNTLHVLGQSIGEAVDPNAGDFDAIKAAGRFGSAVLGSFNPLGSESTLLQLAAPTIADPFVQWAQNKNFAGIPIKPEQMPFDVPKPEYQLYFQSARKPSKWIAKMLSDYTGGDEVRPGLANVSPEVIDLFLETMMGGAGRFMENTLALPKELAKKKPEVRKMPGLRKVYGEAPDYYLRTKFYDNLSEIRYAQKSVDHYEDNPARLSAVKREYSWESRFIKRAKRDKKKIGDLRKKRKKIEAGTESERIKEAKLQDIEKQITQIMTAFNRTYKKRTSAAYMPTTPSIGAPYAPTTGLTLREAMQIK